MNTVVYYGRKPDRDLIRRLEFAFDVDKPVGEEFAFDLSRYQERRHSTYLAEVEADLSVCDPPPKKRILGFDSVVFDRKLWKADVVITTPEVVSGGNHAELEAVEWQVLVMDECHRLKNSQSKVRN